MMVIFPHVFQYQSRAPVIEVSVAQPDVIKELKGALAAKAKKAAKLLEAQNEYAAAIKAVEIILAKL